MDHWSGWKKKSTHGLFVYIFHFEIQVTESVLPEPATTYYGWRPTHPWSSSDSQSLPQAQQQASSSHAPVNAELTQSLSPGQQRPSSSQVSISTELTRELVDRLQDAGVSVPERIHNFGRIKHTFGTTNLPFDPNDPSMPIVRTIKTLRKFTHNKLSISPLAKKYVLMYLARDRTKGVASEILIGIRECVSSVSISTDETTLFTELTRLMYKEDMCQSSLHMYQLLSLIMQSGLYLR